MVNEGSGKKIPMPKTFREVAQASGSVAWRSVKIMCFRAIFAHQDLKICSIQAVFSITFVAFTSQLQHFWYPLVTNIAAAAHLVVKDSAACNTASEIQARCTNPES